ncbi:hypothetical protein GOP47_0003107 [Adiantum capillus-veneris]|uniref:Cyclin-dependent kinases regulatory subunit n=1 Tax=Adiantum capillus-veneris TaxID=13818 RepID=A0A9D4ZPS7_ADICA|nr:hypothetical protein GOP47_0003107 [Adiantum capillus-veneris]
MPQIQYSEKYFDDVYEYRHVVLTPEITKLLPKNRLLSEAEWRALGVQQLDLIINVFKCLKFFYRRFWQMSFASVADLVFAPYRGFDYFEH